MSGIMNGYWLAPPMIPDSYVAFPRIDMRLPLQS